MTVRLYYPEPLPGVPVHPVFHYRHPLKGKGSGLFQDVQYHFFEEAEIKDLQQADALVLVNNFAKEPDETARAYIRSHADEAEKLGKPIYIFSTGDFTDTLHFDPRVWVFRYSVYRSTMSPRDIVVPTNTEPPPEDLLSIKPKHEKPLVAFCGMGGFPKLRGWVKYYVKNFLYDLRALVRPAARAQKLGVYWRRAMMRACSRSPLVDTNFIVRRSFSANAKSIELDPAQARREYLETTANADFVLAPKGDGNYSNRFLKTLAFGRIPVLVDTDIVLPLENIIDYSKIVVQVPMTRVGDTARLVHEYYSPLTSEEWGKRQELARNTFEQYLQQDAFFRQFFAQTHG
jgi:hypothetical protein